MWARTFRYIIRNTIKFGAIKVTLPDGSSVIAGDASVEPLSITVSDEKSLKALCINPDLALGESYINETLTIENDDLKGLLEIIVKNVNGHSAVISRRILDLARLSLRRADQFNPVKRAKTNVQHHYDLTNELYELFLDKDLQYSCAYFANPDDSLEEAQIQKKKHIAKKLLLPERARILDIGSGWGGLGLTLAKDFGCHVLGVTLSTVQHEKSNIRARESGIADKAQFALMDYRAVREKFDRIVSVGMFEHVGVPHYRKYFRSVHKLLKDDGVALIHTIGRSGKPGSTNPWIKKYIFPGGYVPSMSEVMTAIERENLVVTDVEVLRLHYAKTVACWYDRFMSNIDRIREIYDDRFCRMWRFYLVASEMSFLQGDQVVFQFQIAKKNNTVPLSRDYLYSDS